MNALKWAFSSVRDKGLVQTVQAAANVVMDRSFDWRYGTDTLQWVDRAEIDTSSKNKVFSEPYKATKARPFRKLLRNLELPKDCAFVDIGSGKGRILMIAAQHGFQTVVGLEFSAPLCEIARRNVDIFSEKVPVSSVFDVVETDATEYQFGPDQRVFFMFSPFGEPVIENLMKSFSRSLAENPRKIWLIYNYPVHHKVVSGSGLFPTESFHEIGGTHFRVYET